MNDPDKQIKCATCKYTSKKGCTIFKSAADVWKKCLGGESSTLKEIIVPHGWNKPMPYSYVCWQPKDQILPDELFEI